MEKTTEDGRDQVSIDKLCEQRLPLDVLQGIREVEFSLGVQLSGGKIKLDTHIELPVKLRKLFLISLFLAGGTEYGKAVFLKIIEFL